MRLAIAALTAALLLVDAESLAQDAAGTAENKAAAEPGAAAVEPPVRPQAAPKPRTQFLLDVLNDLVRPRPASVADPAVPAPSGSVPTSSSASPAPAGASPAGTVTVPGVVPGNVKAEPSPVPPRPVTATESIPARPVPAVGEPAGAVADSPAAPPPAPIAAAQPAPEQKAAADATSARAGSSPGTIGWLLVGLLAAAAIAASLLHLRRTRRIARTRAALALEPRFDVSAGARTFTGLSLACPPLAIRTRLDFGETRGG